MWSSVKIYHLHLGIACPNTGPWGGINRSRKLVYETISLFRHKYNNVARQEPTSWEIGAK